jgi:sortase A
MPMKRKAAVLAIVGFVLVAYCVSVHIRASCYQASEKRRFENEARVEEQPRPSPVQPDPGRLTGRMPLSRGEPVAVITIPRLGLSAVVLEGAGAKELKLGPGHISRTPLPGEGGNFSVAGHRDTFFRPLRLIGAGDVIVIQRRAQIFRYKVVSTRIVNPADVHVLESTGRDTLTLVTCYPFNFVGSAPKRLIVHADCESCSPPELKR